MTVLLASRELDLLQATKFALECRGLTVLLAVREADIVNYLVEGVVDILALDIGLSENGTGKIVERIQGDHRFVGPVLILFSKSLAQLQNACSDRDVLDQADDVLVEMFDESGLIDKVTSAARRVRIEKSQYHAHAAEWKDPYAVNSLSERRKDPRFRLDAPIKIRGKDLLREPFEEDTLMVNLSGGGAYLKSRHHLEKHAPLEISVRGPYATNGALDLRSTVVRAEHGNDRQDPKRRRAAVRFNDDVKQSIEFQLLLAKLSSAP
jgi:DNA-binding response OmpR family regulator